LPPTAATPAAVNPGSRQYCVDPSPMAATAPPADMPYNHNNQHHHCNAHAASHPGHTGHAGCGSYPCNQGGAAGAGAPYGAHPFSHFGGRRGGHHYGNHFGSHFGGHFGGPSAPFGGPFGGPFGAAPGCRQAPPHAFAHEGHGNYQNHEHHGHGHGRHGHGHGHRCRGNGHPFFQLDEEQRKKMVERITTAKKAEDVDALLDILAEFGLEDRDANRKLLAENDNRVRKVIKLAAKQQQKSQEGASNANNAKSEAAVVEDNGTGESKAVAFVSDEDDDDQDELEGKDGDRVGEDFVHVADDGEDRHGRNRHHHRHNHGGHGALRSHPFFQMKGEERAKMTDRIKAAKKANDTEALLDILAEFGFADREGNRVLLQANQGKVRKVIKIILKAEAESEPKAETTPAGPTVAPAAVAANGNNGDAAVNNGEAHPGWTSAWGAGAPWQGHHWHHHHHGHGHQYGHHYNHRHQSNNAQGAWNTF